MNPLFLCQMLYNRNVELTSKKTIVTGAASGIGQALIAELCKQDVQIVAVDVRPIDLSAFEHPERIFPLTFDLSRPEQVDALFEQALGVLGRIDLFFANAGFAYYEHLSHADWEHLERIFQVNVFSAIHAALKMQELNRHKPYRVVITASAMAYIPLPKYALYSSTKAALHAFADSHRWQLSDPRSLVLVYPIATRTAFFQQASSKTPVPWPSQTPQEVARAILKGIAADQTSIFPSDVFRVGLKLRAIFPFLHRLIQWREQVRKK